MNPSARAALLRTSAPGSRRPPRRPRLLSSPAARAVRSAAPISGVLPPRGRTSAHPSVQPGVWRAARSSRANSRAGSVNVPGEPSELYGTRPPKSQGARCGAGLDRCPIEPPARAVECGQGRGAPRDRVAGGDADTFQAEVKGKGDPREGSAPVSRSALRRVRRRNPSGTGLGKRGTVAPMKPVQSFP